MLVHVKCGNSTLLKCKEGFKCENGKPACKPDWVGDKCCYSCNNTCIGTATCAKRIIYVNGRQATQPVCTCPYKYQYVKGRGCVSRCTFNSSLDYCPQDNTPLYLGLGLTIGLCVLLMLVFSLIVYFLWRRRILWAQKLVYLFLPYQDDSDKADAYVSCCESGSGNQFVYTHLLPRLEDQLSYKLLVHHRNFELGRPLQDNIIEAIESSSRVILVLTRDFVNSEWQLLESHAAFHQMIKMKTRIIPVLLEDVRKDPNLQPGLKYLLSSVTCLQPPMSNSDHQSAAWQRFWRRLHYCMPKHRSTGHSESRLTACLRRRYAASSYGDEDVHSIDSATATRDTRATSVSNGNISQQAEQADHEPRREEVSTASSTHLTRDEHEPIRSSEQLYTEEASTTSLYIQPPNTSEVRKYWRQDDSIVTTHM